MVVVRVRIMRMGVGDWLMPMPVRMTGPGRHRLGMVMLVVRIARVPVLVPLGKVQPSAGGSTRQARST